MIFFSGKRREDEWNWVARRWRKNTYTERSTSVSALEGTATAAAAPSIAIAIVIDERRPYIQIRCGQWGENVTTKQNIHEKLKQKRPATPTHRHPPSRPTPPYTPDKTQLANDIVYIRNYLHRSWCGACCSVVIFGLCDTAFALIFRYRCSSFAPLRPSILVSISINSISPMSRFL